MKISSRAKSALALILTLVMLLTLIPMGVGMASEEPTEPVVVEETETTEPTKETPEPTKVTTTDPAKETTDPAKETTDPAKETTDPTKETTDPTKETADPTKETTDATKLTDEQKTDEEAVEETIDAAVEAEEELDEANNPLETVSVQGSISWKNFPEGEARPKITITLLRNGSVVGEKISTNLDSYTFKGIDKAEGDTFAIRVAKISGYKISISGKNITVEFIEKTESDEPEATNTEDDAVTVVKGLIDKLPSVEVASSYTAEALAGIEGAVKAAASAAYELSDEQMRQIEEELNKLADLMALFDADNLDQGVKDVSRSIELLPSLEEAKALDAAGLAALKTKLAAIEAEIATLGYRKSDIDSQLLSKLAALKTLVGESGQVAPGASIMAYQQGTVTVRILFTNVLDAEKRACSIGYTLAAFDANESQMPYGDSDVLREDNGWEVIYTGVNMLRGCTVTMDSSSIPTGYAASGPIETINYFPTMSYTYTFTVSPVVAGQNISAKIVWDSTVPAPSPITVTLSDGPSGSITTHDLTPNAAAVDLVSRVEGKVYSLTAPDQLGYDKTITFNNSTGLFTVTYTKSKSTFQYNGRLVWRTGGEPDNRAPITVTLRERNTGRVVGSAVLPWQDNSFHFVDVPQYDPYGNLLFYYVTASDTPAGYAVSVDTGRTDSQATIYLDKPDAAHFNIHVKVNWSDNNNSRGKRPVETTLYLYDSNGEQVAAASPIQMKYADGWVNVFPNVDKFWGGDPSKPITYTIKAAKVDGYYTKTMYVSVHKASATVTYYYGSPSSESTTAPKVGDPAVLNAASLTPLQRLQYAAEDSRAAAVAAEAARIARANPTSGADIDFTALRKQNSDVAAWLYSDGTAIDYPVVKGSNNSYYLNHLYNKESNRSGALFIDSNCNRNLRSRNTVIYGHHMGEGSMFASLLEYKNQSYFDQHPTMQLFTASKDYDIEIFAAFTTSDHYDDVARLKFSGNGDFMSYVNACIKKSDISTSVDVSAGDSIVTMVTCSYDYDNTRYLVMGRLVEK